MSIKRLLALLLACLMIVSMVACGGKGGDETTDDSAIVTEDNGDNTENEETGVVFPLKEQMTFDIIITNDNDWDKKLASNPLWQDLQEKTNVKINVVRISRSDGTSAFNNMLLSNKKWDGVFSAFMTDTDVATMIGNGVFMPVTDMIQDETICPNFVNRVLEEAPHVLNKMTAPDGEIYGLQGTSGLLGGALESPMLINKAWVEAVGWKVEDIKTLQDLEDVLVLFAEEDPNGNGKYDEIPYMLYQNNSQRHFEAFLGLYGIATKDGTFENYVTVENGEVKFVPMLNGWKQAVKTLARWYEMGLVYDNAFSGITYNEAHWSIFNDSVCRIGLLTSNSAPVNFEEQYVALEPVEVKGYEPRWYIHPGDCKPLFMVSKNCENPEVLLAFVDQFLSMENSLRYIYGEEGQKWETNDDGMIEILELTSHEEEVMRKGKPTLKQITQDGTTLLSCFTTEDYQERILMSEDEERMEEYYNVYAEYITGESWPRPIFEAEAAKDINELRTDIMSFVALKRAEWITGVSDIDAEYDDFVEDLEKMDVEELIELMQDAYDVYIGKDKD